MSAEGGAPASKARFIADAMLGSLARWMRTLGCDVEYASGIEDAELVKKAVEEDRVILTRDTLLMKRRAARDRAFFVESDCVAEQLRQVARSFPMPQSPVLDRCLRCNTPLERMDKASARALVPPYVFRTHEEFSRCPSCGRVYWAGTHRKEMEREVARFFGPGGDADKDGR